MSPSGSLGADRDARSTTNGTNSTNRISGNAESANNRENVTGGSPGSDIGRFLSSSEVDSIDAGGDADMYLPTVSEEELYGPKDSVDFDWLHLSEDEDEQEYEVYTQELAPESEELFNCDHHRYQMELQSNQKGSIYSQTVPKPSEVRSEYSLSSQMRRNSKENTDLISRNIAPRYYMPYTVCPELKILTQNTDKIMEELNSLMDPKSEKSDKWTPWPEETLYSGEHQQGNWKVIPLLYTFPATDESSMKWVKQNCDLCPNTVALLKQIPGIRTALFSRMGACTRLSTHQGWADLANYVLRCHLPLIVPDEYHNLCGMWVEGQVQYHKPDNIIMFDDSKWHKAFNATNKDRVVLLFDIMRPWYLPYGRAKGGHTDKLDQFISAFNSLKT